MQTLEEKKTREKERHRRSMALKRAVFKANLDASREELHTLFDQQLSLLAAYWEQQQSSPIDVGTALASATNMPLVYDAYVGAVELGNAINLDNDELRKRLDQYEKFESALHRDVTQFENDSPDELRDDSTSRTCCQFTEGDEPFYYEAVDAATCQSIVRDNYPLFWDHHSKFMQDANLELQPFFGWQVRRLVSNGHHFHFSKRISSSNCAQMTEFIGDEAWRVFNTPELYERLYSTRVVMHILQRVDVNTSVALQSLPAIDHSVSRRCLTLASKIVNIDEERHRIVTVLLLGISPNEDMEKRKAPSVQFIQDTNAYLVLHQREDDYGQEFVDMSFGLHGDYESDNEARFAFLESANALIRFEQLILPQTVVTVEAID